MHVCVLGAGIIGLSTAYELNQRGFKVTVVDGADQVGAGASGQNGAQLSYSYVQPLADPSIWAHLPELLLSSDSPLKWSPQFDPQQWLWLLSFLRACNRTDSENSTAELIALAGLSRVSLDAMRDREKIDCDFSNTGKLVLYSSQKSFSAAQKQMALQASLGCEQQALDPLNCIQLEPALLHYKSNIVGGIYTASECAIDTLKLCTSLEAILRTRGVQFLLNNTVCQLTVRGRRVTEVLTKSDSIDADFFVLACGSSSASLARSVNVSLPIYPIKGYSVTFDLADTNVLSENLAPHVNVTDTSRKIVFARLGHRLRVAGMAEIVGYDASIDSSAIAKLIAATHHLFPQLETCPVSQAWAGLRPATPTGLPVIGKREDAPDNLIFNAGHGGLGLTLAFGSAVQVASLIQ